jgi:hypothetical protein
MTRVNFEIPNDLHEAFKCYAAENKISLKSLFINSAQKIVSKSRAPNTDTIQAISDTKNRRNLTRCDTTKELFERFGIVNE